MVPHAVENQVIPLPTGCEIFTGVINDLIRTDGSNHIHIARTAYASDLRAEGLGNLDGERTHAARRSVNQDLLPLLSWSLGAKTLQGGVCHHGHTGRLLKRDVIGFSTNVDSGAQAYSAKAPWQTQTLKPEACGSRIHAPNTASPGFS